MGGYLWSLFLLTEEALLVSCSLRAKSCVVVRVGQAAARKSKSDVIIMSTSTNSSKKKNYSLLVPP